MKNDYKLQKTKFYIDSTNEFFDGYKSNISNPLFNTEQIKIVQKRFDLHYSKDEDMYFDRPGEYVARPLIINNSKYYVFTMDWLWCMKEEQ